MTVKRTQLLAITGALSCLGILSACTTLPDSSEPEAVSSYQASPNVEETITPTPGSPSDLLLRDFFTASAHPLVNHEAARRFLTTEASEDWKTSGEMFILDKMDIVTEGSVGEGHVTYKVRGNLIGSLGPGGAYTPLFTGYETTYEMVREEGEWRVDDLPNAVIVDRGDFASMYQPRPVYYLDQPGSNLVPDRRWVYTQQQSLAASLVSLLIAGPREDLSKGVRTMLPPNATAQTRTQPGKGVTVELTGLTNLNAAERELLAAQVVWTLAASEVRGPYTITADGVALSETVGNVWQVDDVSRFDPYAEAVMPLRAIVNGSVMEVDQHDSEAEPLDGWLSQQQNVESVAVTPQGSIFAAVTGRGQEERELKVGAQDDDPQVAIRADSLTRPTWGASSRTLYTVKDGREIVRLDRREMGSIDQSKVNMDAVPQLRDRDARISVFRVSRDGTRAVMLINGYVYVALLENDSNGGQKLGNPVQVGHQIGDRAISADWHPDGSLIVGTRAADSPLWSVAVDGSNAVQLPSGNLSAPVVAVAANSRVLYATDARALMQLDNSSEDVSFWREVPSLQGQRAAPVLSN